jgi:hypothetical protein
VAVAGLVDLLGDQVLTDLEELATDANTLVRVAVAEALGKRIPLPAAAHAVLARLAADQAAPVARAAQEALARQPESPVPVPIASESNRLLPSALVEQAAAARAFLARWQAELPAQPSEERTRVEQALTTLLEVLGK